MKNIIVLQKLEDGRLHCREITDEGIKYIANAERTQAGSVYWKDGGTIEREELDIILDKERKDV